MRLGNERIGRLGTAILGIVAVLGAVLAVHGVRSPGVTGVSSAPGSTLHHSHPGTRSSSPRSARRSSGARSQHQVGTHAKLGPPLASTQYAAYAFRIYPGPRTPATRQALAGFRISVVPQGSRVRVQVVQTGSSQPPTTRVYPRSDRIYFIEASMGDDPNMSELNLGDDGLVVTNAQGRIVE